MRLKIKLAANGTNAVSFNYNYPLSAAIYKLLKLGSPEFSTFLHEKGFKVQNKKYKLFTFALVFQNTSFSNQVIKLNSPSAYLYISSPLIEDFIKNFVIGTFEQQRIEIAANFINSKFNIEQVELIPKPIFFGKAFFKLMSPLVLSTSKTFNGSLSQYYFRYNDNIDEINRVFENNLINKFKVITNNEYNGEGIKLCWDDDYIKNALKKNKRLSKKVSIYKDVNNPIDIIGIFCPFNVTGDPKLIEIGYECGFGEKNSMGFGMAEMINNYQ